MSMSFTPSNNKGAECKTKITYNSDSPKVFSNSKSRQIESAKFKFRPKSHAVFRKGQKKVINDFTQNSYTMDNNFSVNHSTPIPKRPIWKYSYYVDKNDILNVNNDPEIRNLLNNYRDFDSKPKPVTYSWTKPRMIKIIENNKIIEEEIKSTFWKYSYMFQNYMIKPPGRLLKLMVNQLTSGYGNDYGYMNINRNGVNMNDSKNLRNKFFHDKHWRHPGVYRDKKNEYEPIKIKRAK